MEIMTVKELLVTAGCILFGIVFVAAMWWDLSGRINGESDGSDDQNSSTDN